MNSQRSRRRMLRLLGVAGIFGGIPSFASESSGQCNSQSDHREWVEECLKRMLTIQPGMTRNQLMAVFTTEGGISSAKQRTFVSRECPYFKITVEFRRADESTPAGKQTVFLRGDSVNRIESIPRRIVDFDSNCLNRDFHKEAAEFLVQKRPRAHIVCQ